MKITREAVLNRTHYGIKIYAYILRQYFPQNTLFLAGNTCRPTRNPFNHNKPTLRIQIEDSLAVHSDLELPDFRGDAFDFANKFLKAATNEELYYLLNQLMHLGLKVEAEDKLAWLKLQDDTWRPMISYYNAPVRNVFPAEEISLAEVHARITGSHYEAITEKLRSLTDPKEKRIFKANQFPYVTFSGTFHKRSDKALKEHSLLIAFDFDHLPNLPEVRQQLMEDEYLETEMLFISPSGDGLKWIIKFNPHEASHREFFQGVSNYLNRTYHLDVDPSGKDTSRACFLPKDPSAYLHPRHAPELNVKSDEP